MSSAESQASSHWYAGTQFSGGSSRAVYIEAGLSTPGGLPSSRDYYFVGVSAWDNQESYDQIGMLAYHGLWRLVYSTTTNGCEDPDYHMVIDLPLNVSSYYIFTMGVYSNTSDPSKNGIIFSLVGDGQLLYTDGVSEPGVTTFSIAKHFCAAGDYQDYEEIYRASGVGHVPGFNFDFLVNAYCTANCSTSSFASWIPWKSKTAGLVAPKVVNVTVSGDSVSIDN